jgi:ribosome-associated toxin RatA of RatAB toxin-antitoxin module
MAKAEFHEVLPIDKDKLFAAIARYEDYPEFVEGCTSIKVDRKGAGQARVTYHVSMMKDVTYTLDHVEKPEEGVVEWSLVESDFFKQNIGRWQLKAAGDGKTDVLYTVDLDFKIPVPGFILNRLVKGSLPSMVKSFQKRASKG